MAEQKQFNLEWHPLHAPHGGVAVQVFTYREEDDTFGISHRGKPSELIAAGAADALTLRPYSRSTGRVDADGDACRIMNGSLSRGGRIELCRYKSPEGAAKLAGVTKEMLRQVRGLFEIRDRTADERNEARYRAEELVITSLRRMPAKEVPNKEEALRFLADLRDLLHLAHSRRGAVDELRACLADQISLAQAVRFLNNLPTYNEETVNRAERNPRHLRLVVDNTKR